MPLVRGFFTKGMNGETWGSFAESCPRFGVNVFVNNPWGFKGSAVRPRSTPAYTMRQRAADTPAKEPRKSEGSEQEPESNKQESPT